MSDILIKFDGAAVAQHASGHQNGFIAHLANLIANSDHSIEQAHAVAKSDFAKDAALNVASNLPKFAVAMDASPAMQTIGQLQQAGGGITV